MRVTIKPCPFCGGEGISQKRVFWDTDAAAAADIYKEGGTLTVTADGFGWYRVACERCRMEGPKIRGVSTTRDPSGVKVRESALKAIDAWNTRACSCSQQMRLELE